MFEREKGERERGEEHIVVCKYSVYICYYLLRGYHNKWGGELDRAQTLSSKLPSIPATSIQLTFLI